MDKAYTPGDILQMAVQAKDRGVDLYLALAHNSENYHVARLFMELAKDEKNHKHELEKWRERFSGKTREEAYPGERSVYLNNLVESNTYNCDIATKKALEKTISEEDALRAGIGFEKDFMLFMHDLKHNADEAAQDAIDTLIEDEIRHMKDIFELKDRLEKGE
jgi:rubrerythrin